MFTSALLTGSVIAIALLLAVALLTAWRDFSLGPHVIAWAGSFGVSTLTSSFRFLAHARPEWQGLMICLSCICSIGCFAFLAWGFRRRVRQPARVVTEVAGLILLLIAVLWVHNGAGWITGVRVLTAIGNVALIGIILSSLRGMRSTIWLARGIFALCAIYVTSLGVLAVAAGKNPAETANLFRLVLMLGSPLSIVSIGVLTLLIVAADLARELRLQAWTDALTGLLNRRGLDQRVAELRAQRKREAPLQVVVTDLDHFKKINDTLGHAAGDAVLRRFARQLTGELKGGEIGARIGGEEFLLLLPDASLPDTLLRVERLRRAVPAAVQDLVGLDRITASFGVASLRPDEPLEAAIARADLALYRSKHEGRDRVTCEDPLAA